MWYRREERGVGFDKQAISGAGNGRITDLRRTFEGDDPAE
jgi:hypothetical protein